MSRPFSEAASLLRDRGIKPTRQRLLILRTLLDHGVHLAAEDVFAAIRRENGKGVSKATVYNTLGLLARRGVIREVIADPHRVFYDPNILPHHHIYNETTGELIDVDVSEVSVTRLPSVPEGAEFRGVDVTVRVRTVAKK